MQQPNTDHDEEAIRASWHGCAFLDVESMHAPKHESPRNVTGGMEAWLAAHNVEVRR